MMSKPSDTIVSTMTHPTDPRGLAVAIDQLRIGYEDLRQQHEVFALATRANLDQVLAQFTSAQGALIEALHSEAALRDKADQQLLALLNAALAEQIAARLKAQSGLLEAMIRQRVAFPAGAAGSPVGTERFPSHLAAPEIMPVAPLAEQMEALRRLAPLNFETYRRCLDTGTASYEGLPSESCSTERHPQAMLFRAFVRPYLTGHALDIGCGPQPVPSYLVDHPTSHIVGIDPISSQSDHPFRFVSGFGEFLPFLDNSFDIVISGTTLDHYYLLDRGLDEVARVLRPGGRFLAWIAEFAGAPAYDPYAGPAPSFDEEHMYHIDRAWFLPMMRERGLVEQETVLFADPFNYLFMCFECAK